MKLKNIFYTFICIGFISLELNGMFPINFSRPYDPHLKPPEWCGAPFQFSFWAEGGHFERGADSQNPDVNVLQIWQRDQNALAMLKGFSDESPMSQTLETIISDAGTPELDNDIRGHFTATGDFKYKTGGGITARYHLPHNFSLAAYTAFYSMQLKNISFVDKTGNVTMSDAAVREHLTDNFIATVKKFDQNLNLGGWKRAGASDIIFMAEWLRHFPQVKPILRNVTLNARCGATVPTGLKINENDILSVPYGFDGSSGIIFGGGIKVNWFNLINGGFDIELIHFFGNTRTRRIKVAEDQTELLFLAKTPAHKDFGITQRYNLFLQADQFYKGFSAGIAYQYWRHGEDKLSLCSYDFSTAIANTAESLQEWTIHQMIFTLSYDCYDHIYDSSIWKPQFRVFYRFPFNGKRAILTHTAGAMITFNF